MTHSTQLLDVDIQGHKSCEFICTSHHMESRTDLLDFKVSVRLVSSEIVRDPMHLYFEVVTCIYNSDFTLEDLNVLHHD
jgi:hypothetical protein